MTGIYNRRKFFELAEKKFEQFDDDLYAAMIDIDRFKSINDTYGHATGDRVIKKIANTLLDCINPESVLGRIGGEDFAIVCTSGDKEHLEQQIEQLRRKVESLSVNSDNDEEVKFTISSGIAKKTDTCITLDHLLKKADDALYEAKGTGRNKAIFRNI